MKILYLSSMFDDSIIEKIYTKGKLPNFAANKYHQLLSQGLAKCGVSVNTYLTLPVSRSLSDKKIIKIPVQKEDNLKKQYISVINSKLIKIFLLFIKSFFKTLFMSKDTVIVYDVLVVPSSLGALMASKIRGLSSLAIVTDLPDFMHAESKKAKRAINNKLLTFASGYVFLTRQMNDVINTANKPYIVLEGHVDVEMQICRHEPFTNSNKKIIYAGGLQKIYGIADLVEAFISCGKDNEELHIYGDGDFANELSDISKKHHNIIYHGCKPNKDIVKAELSAVLMVNPRNCQGEYTKYSFPSKTLEYMVSGTPVLMAKLPGVPDDYDSYVYYFDDTDPDGLKNELRCVLDKDMTELSKKGENARDYALKAKNNVSQAQNIVNFILKHFM